MRVSGCPAAPHLCISVFYIAGRACSNEECRVRTWSRLYAQRSLRVFFSSLLCRYTRRRTRTTVSHWQQWHRCTVRLLVRLRIVVYGAARTPNVRFDCESNRAAVGTEHIDYRPVRGYKLISIYSILSVDRTRVPVRLARDRRRRAAAERGPVRHDTRHTDSRRRRDASGSGSACSASVRRGRGAASRVRCPDDATRLATPAHGGSGAPPSGVSQDGASGGERRGQPSAPRRPARRQTETYRFQILLHARLHDIRVNEILRVLDPSIGEAIQNQDFFPVLESWEPRLGQSSPGAPAGEQNSEM